MTQLRILHLEDDPFVAELAQLELARNNIHCTWINAENAEAFLNAIDRQQFDLILSDLSVPGMDGHRALAEARARSPHVPFVFVSGNDDAKEIKRCLSEGATDYIVKDQLWRLVPTLRELKCA